MNKEEIIKQENNGYVRYWVENTFKDSTKEHMRKFIKKLTDKNYIIVKHHTVNTGMVFSIRNDDSSTNRTAILSIKNRHVGFDDIKNKYHFVYKNNILEWNGNTSKPFCIDDIHNYEHDIDIWLSGRSKEYTENFNNLTEIISFKKNEYDDDKLIIINEESKKLVETYIECLKKYTENIGIHLDWSLQIDLESGDGYIYELIICNNKNSKSVCISFYLYKDNPCYINFDIPYYSKATSSQEYNVININKYLDISDNIKPIKENNFLIEKTLNVLFPEYKSKYRKYKIISNI